MKPAFSLRRFSLPSLAACGLTLTLGGALFTSLTPAAAAPQETPAPAATPLPAQPVPTPAPAPAPAAKKPAPDADAELAAKISGHQEGSRKLAGDQDELAGDVQQLTIEQTHPKVIELLQAVEEAMDDASGRLLDHDTGGSTLAAQTDVIEKIFEAAKERQKQQGGQNSEAGGAMLDMLQRMMGQEPGQQQGQQPGPKPGDQGGEGMTGQSDTGNTQDQGAAQGGKVEERRVPKASGRAGQSLPGEFQQALDAYNRAAEKLNK